MKIKVRVARGVKGKGMYGLLDAPKKKRKKAGVVYVGTSGFGVGGVEAAVGKAGVAYVDAGRAVMGGSAGGARVLEGLERGMALLGLARGVCFVERTVSTRSLVADLARLCAEAHPDLSLVPVTGPEQAVALLLAMGSAEPPEELPLPSRGLAFSRASRSLLVSSVPRLGKAKADSILGSVITIRSLAAQSPSDLVSLPASGMSSTIVARLTAMLDEPLLP